MIDIHCHILPGLDDGPKSVDESIEMCRIAAADGITIIVATPHYRPGRYETAGNLVVTKMRELQRELDREGIGIGLLPGADVTLTPELLFTLRSHPDLTINMTGKYFLAEFPHEAIPPRWEAYLHSFLSAGFVPIVTHPERNPWFQRHPDALVPFIRNGGMVQVTSMSLTGEAGRDVLDCCVHLLKRNMVHVIASDAHSAEYRMPVLAEAVRKAGAIVGMEQARALVTDIPRSIVGGWAVCLPEPVEGSRSKNWVRRLLGGL